MSKANQAANDSKQENGFAMGMIVQLALVIVLVGIVSMVGIYILESVADKTALTASDTFFNAADNVTEAVETGFSFMEIIILAVVAGIVILAIFTYIPIKL